jgi:alkanesulfonate monooxygenase SsuD/methylene tetrahydromethanopterin reductase-like flavin-dependent oxidoreductase (luciferase family)
VVFGGNSEPALRRSVQNGDGWFGFNLLPEEAAPSVQLLHRFAQDAGRRVDDLFIGVGASEQIPKLALDDLKRYRDAGVKQVVVRLPTASPERIDAALDAMAEQLVYPAQAL